MVNFQPGANRRIYDRILSGQIEPALAFNCAPQNSQIEWQDFGSRPDPLLHLLEARRLVLRTVDQQLHHVLRRGHTFYKRSASRELRQFVRHACPKSLTIDMSSRKRLMGLNEAIGRNQQSNPVLCGELEQRFTRCYFLLLERYSNDEVRFDKDIHAAISATTRPLAIACSKPVSRSARISSGADGCQR